ncbi:hypothetical protein KGP36_02355 [Patescibacteria group bacterium]|nr:hypothetical protein [Patescibacteria group bacterium]
MSKREVKVDPWLYTQILEVTAKARPKPIKAKKGGGKSAMTKARNLERLINAADFDEDDQAPAIRQICSILIGAKIGDGGKAGKSTEALPKLIAVIYGGTIHIKYTEAGGDDWLDEDGDSSDLNTRGYIIPTVGQLTKFLRSRNERWWHRLAYLLED